MAGTQSLKQLLHGVAGARDYQIRCNFRERNQDEGAIRQAGVGNLEAGRMDDLVSVEEDVEIEGAGAIRDGRGAVTPEFALDAEELIEKFACGQVRFEGEDGIEETRLIGEADGDCGVERRARGDTAEGCQAIGGGGQRGFWWTGGSGNVGAEGYVGGRH